jgi:hypothetical protein
MPMDALDDAAAAALWSMRKSPIEYMAALSASGDGYQKSNSIESGSSGRVKGQLSVPKGALRALVHNHPGEGAEVGSFSDADKAQAKKLNVESYITTPDGRVQSYYPYRSPTTREVLAQFPWDEQKRQIMVEILRRDPNDPRGARR